MAMPRRPQWIAPFDWPRAPRAHTIEPHVVALALMSGTLAVVVAIAGAGAAW
jgi:hypothetical protein